jgi:hypothetical protein
MHNYIYEPSREPWPGASVNARIPPVPLMRNGEPVLDDNGEQVMQTASAWLDQNKPVEQMTWAPGLPMIIRDRLVSAGGWIERKGVSCFNLYRPPEIELGDADEAGPWIAHVHRLYSKDDAHHVIQWSLTAGNVRRKRSITRSYSVARRALVKTRCWSRPSAQSDPGISAKYRRSTCSGDSTASSNR